jgi:dTMP kinase
VTGAFLTFEGIDGCGKSTQMRMLETELQSRGFDVVSTHEPGGTALGLRLRAAILDPKEVVDPLAEILIYAADRAQHVRTVVVPALEAGKIVLSDRYADSTIAFQGGGRGFSSELVKNVVELATGGLKPDLTLIFDLPVAECIARTMSRTDGGIHNDRLESENAEFHTRVRNAYLELARAEPERVHLVDASGMVNETHEKVLQLVELFFARAGVRTQESGLRS